MTGYDVHFAVVHTVCKVLNIHVIYAFVSFICHLYIETYFHLFWICMYASLGAC